ncbi:MAG TPA: hypothetical protein VK669_10285, partial [Candidatus Limnocylindrales bacterium]|nr:hypothetical protein [Candidatus Limnocylindrales bacterium]
MPAFLALALVGAVTALPLPEGYTVTPEGARRLIAVNPRGTVLASASIPNGYAKDRVVRWRRDGTRAVFVPLPAPSWYPSPELEFAEASALAGDDVAYVDVARPFSGAYSGVSYETQRWPAGAAQRFAPVRCGGASGFPHAAAVDTRGRVAMTYDTSAGLILDPEHPASDAPIANLATESSCIALGRGVVLAVRGAYAAGYRGYLGTSLAPIPLNPQQQTMRVVRWHGDTARELGDGVGLAVNASGV